MTEQGNNQLQKAAPHGSGIAFVLKQDAVQHRLNEVLRDRAPQFASSLVSLVNESPLLKKADPRSVVAAAMIAATLDLPIQKNLGFAHIVPYAGVAQFQMGHKGFIQLAMRTGQYERMNAEPVNIEAVKGYDDVGEPVIDWSAFDPLKPAAGYVFAFKLTNGFRKTLYWSKERCLAHAQKFSQAYRYAKEKGKNDTPWIAQEDAMCLKTVVKHGLSKWGILSVELQRALKEDQTAHRDIDAPGEYIDGTSEDLPPADGDEKESRAASLAKKITPEPDVQRDPEDNIDGNGKAPETPAKKPEVDVEKMTLVDDLKRLSASRIVTFKKACAKFGVKFDALEGADTASLLEVKKELTTV